MVYQEYLDCGCLVQVVKDELVNDGVRLLEPCSKHDDRPLPPKLTNEQLLRLVEMIRRA